MPHQQTAKETERIADQLHRLFEGPSWLGPSIQELLKDISDKSAAQHGVPGTHTIWELVLHMTAWLRISRERLSSVEVRDADPAEDWPPMSGSWPDAKSILDSARSALQQAILDFSDEQLEGRAPAAEEQTFYQLLHGVIQHSAYHAGQIALLKKVCSSQTAGS